MQSQATQCAADTVRGSRDTTTPECVPQPTPTPSPTLGQPTSGFLPADTPNVPTASNAAGRQPRSWVWQHFTKVADYASSHHAACKHCTAALKVCSGSTSTMAAHLAKVHYLTPDHGSAAAKPTPGPIPPEKANAHVVRWLVRKGLPFTVVEDEDFNEAIRPEVTVRSAGAVKGRIMKCYEGDGLKRKIDRVHDAGSKISVTLDCWTSPNTKAFMCITAHYIDESWAPQSFVLDFVPLEGEHTGENLCAAFAKVCERFDLLPRLLGVTSDNAANIRNFLKLFDKRTIQGGGPRFNKKEQHVRCAAHVINLVAQELLHELVTAASDDADGGGDDGGGDDGGGAQTEKLSCITKLRKLVKQARVTPQRREAFKAECRENGVQPKELVLDVSTRWNSTYALIKRACELRVPLCALADHHGLSAPNDEEWEVLGVVAQVLRVFDEATVQLCATNHPTLNNAVPTYNCLFDELEGFLGTCDEEDIDLENAAMIDSCTPAVGGLLRRAIGKAHAKLEAFYGRTWAGMYAIAVILDPSLKLDYYAVSGWEPAHVAHARNALQRAVEEYELAGERAAASPQPRVTWRARGNGRVGCSLKRQRTQKGTETEQYLAAPTIEYGEDVLDWWRTNAKTYPCLARIARDYLAIPATSVPSERVFSSGTDLITSKRGSLHDDTIRACMCVDGFY
jgi:hAT family C-terminal dimerisation region